MPRFVDDMKIQYPTLYRPLLLCRTNAIWPIKTRYAFLNIIHRLYGMLCCFSFTSVTTLEGVALIVLGKDIEEFLAIGTLFFLTNVTSIKYCTVIFQIEKIAIIVRHCSKLDASFKSSTDENVRKIHHDYDRFSFIMTMYQTLAILFSTSIVTSGPALKELIIGEQHFVLEDGTVTNMTKKELPIYIWLPFDINTSPGYEIGYFYSGYGGVMIGGFFISSWNCLILSVFICVKGHLDILEYFLINIGRNTSKSLSTAENNRIIKQDIVKCVQLHRDIITLIEKVNDYIGPIMIFHSLTYSILICVCGFKIIISNSYVEKYFLATYVGTCVQNDLIVFYWFGNEVLYKSENIAISIWKSNWYKFNKEARLLLQFMMLRCQKPLYFKIGPFGTISIVTCLGILKGGYAYMALLNRVYSKKHEDD